MRAFRAEIERDHRLVGLGFLHALERLMHDEIARLLVHAANPTPFLLLDRVETLATRSR